MFDWWMSIYFMTILCKRYKCTIKKTMPNALYKNRTCLFGRRLLRNICLTTESLHILRKRVHENINKIYKHYYLHFSLQMFLMCFFFNEKIVFNHHLWKAGRMTISRKLINKMADMDDDNWVAPASLHL